MESRRHAWKPQSYRFGQLSKTGTELTKVLFAMRPMGRIVAGLIKEVQVCKEAALSRMTILRRALALMTDESLVLGSAEEGARWCVQVTYEQRNGGLAIWWDDRISAMLDIAHECV